MGKVRPLVLPPPSAPCSAPSASSAVKLSSSSLCLGVSVVKSFSVFLASLAVIPLLVGHVIVNTTIPVTTGSVPVMCRDRLRGSPAKQKAHAPRMRGLENSYVYGCPLIPIPVSSCAWRFALIPRLCRGIPLDHQTTTHEFLMEPVLLDEQDFLIRRQRPEVVGHNDFQLIRDRADGKHRRQHLVAGVTGLGLEVLGFVVHDLLKVVDGIL